MSHPNRSLKSRLILIFFALGILCVAVAGLGIKGIKNANDRAARSYEQLTLPGIAVQNSYNFTLVQVIQLMEAIALTDEASRKERLDFIDKLSQMDDAQFDRFQQSEKPETIQPLALQSARDRAALRKALAKSVSLFRSGDAAGAIAAETNEVRPAGLVFSQDVGKLTDMLEDAIKAAHNDDLSAYQNTMATMLAVLAVGGIAIGTYGWVQIRSIGRSIDGIQTTLLEVSRSLDLTRRVPATRMDEIGHTATAFNELMDRIGSVLGVVSVSMDSVSTASRQISVGNVDLSSRTEEQAASLEETAASMTQLTETVKQNADNAHHANSLAAHANGLADTGHKAVQQMLETIEEISRSSIRISEITGMIEGIAFQTNILALNAAVEAARAGGEGRGFAVVAGEVRGLAQRSASAAKEIKELIGASVALVRDGSRQATDVGTAVEQVKHAIGQVSGIVGEISAASEEQRRGLEQINQAVLQMDGVTQQNAALVEEAAAAAQSLEAQALKMQEAVSAFRLAE